MAEPKKKPRVMSAAERRAADPGEGDVSGVEPAAPPPRTVNRGSRPTKPAVDLPVRTGITLAPDLRIALEKYCVEQRLTFTPVIEQALSEFFASRGIKPMSVRED